ncbi:Gfo/Idh/MocA family oxidoreductase [Xylanimonas ulmi]|uniref:Myo-inositol 2-dehydrogenase/D-chiro-inositol 1-dehydrogenase n=2 Tax=Xylanimonas ulmi TaxID=228973 RepID=A0A4Q7LZH6_9MICO|nr:myo-inositol 2-dehydrogenase/D-chiro-inositol 1-dehydrogenase [Xylanibacterium ulmi]
MIGAGGIAVEHAAAWAALGAEITVFSAEGAQDLATECGGKAVASLDDLLGRSDVVDVMTPTDTHYEYTLAAIEAGRHVVCEKPLARTPAQAGELVWAAARAGVQLYPAQVVRYFPEYVATRNAVAAGRVGRPAVLRLTRSGVFPSWSPWFADDARSGGIVADQMIHDLDIARWIAGEVREVYALRSRADQRQTAHVTLTHVSGAVSSVAGLWGPPHLAFRTAVHVAGDRGVLRYDSAQPTGVRADLAPVAVDGRPRPAAVGGESPYLAQLREFAAAFDGGPLPRVDAVDGAIAVELAAAAQTSIARGEPVRVDTAARACALAAAVGTTDRRSA